MGAQLFASMVDRNIGAKHVEAPLYASTGGRNTCVNSVKELVSAHMESKNQDAGTVEELKSASMGRGRNCASLAGATFLVQIVVLLLSRKEEGSAPLVDQCPAFVLDAVRSGLLAP